MSDVMLTANGASVTLHGGDFDGSGIALTGLSGWYQTPSSKVTVISRGQGDGGHDIAADDIMYDARVVTVGYRIIAGADRGEALRQLSLLDRLVHGLVTCRVIDEGQDTYCSGGYYVRSLDQKIQNPLWQNLSGDITIVFERPERLSSDECSCQLSAMHVSDGSIGLRYGPGYWTEWQGARNGSPSLMHTESNAGLRGLAYPLNYGLKLDGVGSNVSILYNNGTSRAYPVFVVHGPMDGVRLEFPGTQQSIVCDQTVRDVPLILDCRSRTAQLGGQDVSRQLSQRGFPSIPAGGSLRIVLSTLGTGFVDCSVRDTYM